MVGQYNVAVMALSGEVLANTVLAAESPKKAMTRFFKGLDRSVICANKYSTWPELQRAFVSCGGGSCKPCEVSLVGGDRRNFYLVFSQPII